MTFEFTEPTSATLTSVTPRTEKHGDDDVFAISLGFTLTGANTLLDKLSKSLRTTLYKADEEAQGPLPGVEQTTPKLRTAGIELLTLKGAAEGWTLRVDHGIDEDDPITLGGARVDKFRVRPTEGGTVELLFRVGSNDIDAREAGLLCSKLHQEISFTLLAPVKKEETPAIDGAVGHPGLAAQREAEAAGQQRLDDAPADTPEAALTRAAGDPDGEEQQDDGEASAADVAATPARRGRKSKRGNGAAAGAH